MELLNEITRYQALRATAQGLAVEREALNAAVLLLSPIVPHICHALWQALTNEETVLEARWPEVDESALVRSEIEVVVQVNGKLRDRIKVAADADKQAIEGAALSAENVQKFIADGTIRKVIVVPGKLVNIVVS